ncbi:MAG: hemerythrin domain-containing protein [Geminicoccaceae bacterium]
MVTPEPCPAPRVCLDPLPLALLDRPLEFLVADHFRQRCVCAALRSFARTGEALISDAQAVAGYLHHDLPLHHRDEDEDLFPVLLRRTRAEDDLGALLTRLGADHVRAEAKVPVLIDGLTAPVLDHTLHLDQGLCATMLAYAASEHRHLALENGVVLAIARVRLDAGDLAAVAHGMKTRRGVTDDRRTGMPPRLLSATFLFGASA